MARHSRAWIGRLMSALVATSLAAAWAPARAAGGYYSYGHPYGYGYLGDGSAVHQELSYLREQMRIQQIQLQQQIRLQQEQIRLLRQQVSTQHQVTAMQACYYRLSAGIETCEDLFATESSEYAACHETVVERNPGCALDVSRRGLDAASQARQPPSHERARSTK